MNEQYNKYNDLREAKQTARESIDSEDDIRAFKASAKKNKM
jgi:hypothetical protein